MTDKQITIDGIDVSGCIYYEDGKCLNGEMVQCNCKKVAVCYYKEYKRKEQKCEELKDLADHNGRVCNERLDKIDELEHDINELNGQLNQLKAENKILKEKFEIAIKNNMDKTLLRLKKGDVQEELQEIREQFGIETLYCHVDNTRVHRCLDVLKLKDTLTEIKEIAEENDELLQGYHKEWANNKLILQKISECEENDG